MSKNMIQWLEIGDLDIHISDGNYSSKYPRSEEFIESGVPFIRANNLVNKSISDEEMYFISPQKHGLLKKGHLKTNDVLISTRGDLGKVALVPKRYNDSNINAQLVLLRPNPHKIDPLYLLYCFEGDRVKGQISQLQTGTALKQLPVGNLKRIKIPLPPLEEQRRIAAILDKADGVRRKRKEAIRLTEELLRSTFLEMFGDPVTNPKGWRKISLGELLAEPLQNGAYFPKERYVEAPDGVEMVHMSDAFYNFVERGQLKRVQVTSEEFEKYKLIPNDVLIARRSLNYEGSAKPCLISEADQPLIFESSLIRVRLNAEVIDSFFFFSYMLEPRARSAYVFPNVTKSTISGINQAGLRRISVLVPPMSNQKKYRDIYKKILGTQSNYQKDYENIDNLFNSLLQRAFRGEL
ncbi:MAG: restriction endonuclease subunit S [Burkholderiales bacterium]|nr:restriction endonuclease subunit S [Burkholderiales bacterium]